MDEWDKGTKFEGVLWMTGSRERGVDGSNRGPRVAFIPLS